MEDLATVEDLATTEYLATVEDLATVDPSEQWIHKNSSSVFFMFILYLLYGLLLLLFPVQLRVLRLEHLLDRVKHPDRIKY